MDRKTYEREMRKARVMEQSRDRVHYWQGYKRGLRRCFYGEDHGTKEDHDLWMNLADDSEKKKAERGRGYKDALQLGGGRP
jgi:hypothetical protein